MNLKQFKQHIESFPFGHIFKNTISSPFSWRGSYDEVAFSIDVDVEQSREVALFRIEEALTKSFYGYKGDLNRYFEDTEVHFESNYYTNSNGYYAQCLYENHFEHYEELESKIIKSAFQ